jgi:hypothetical protein
VDTHGASLAMLACLSTLIIACLRPPRLIGIKLPLPGFVRPDEKPRNNDQSQLRNPPLALAALALPIDFSE